MDTPTTVPELRRLLDAKKEAENEYLTYDRHDVVLLVTLLDAKMTARATLAAVLTDDTLTAFATALEAAEEHENTVAALSQMTPEAARADGMYPRVTDTSLTLSSALAPLFPKEGTDE